MTPHDRHAALDQALDDARALLSTPCHRLAELLDDATPDLVEIANVADDVGHGCRIVVHLARLLEAEDRESGRAPAARCEDGLGGHLTGAFPVTCGPCREAVKP